MQCRQMRRLAGSGTTSHTSFQGGVKTMRSSRRTIGRRALMRRIRTRSCQFLRFTASYASRLNSTANG